MILEVVVGGLLFMGGTAVFRRVTFPSVRSFLPSKTLRGSPEDLDPNQIAVNLAITRMLRNIDKVFEVTGDRLSYSDDKISYFRFHTTRRYFLADDYISSRIVVELQVDRSNVILEGKYPRIAKQMLSVWKIYQEKQEQKAKEAANAKAFAVIEALTGAKPTSDLPPCGQKNCNGDDCGGLCSHCP